MLFRYFLKGKKGAGRRTFQIRRRTIAVHFKLQIIQFAPVFATFALIVCGLILGVYNTTFAGTTDDGTQPFRESVYGFYENADSITPGKSLAENGMPSRLKNAGDTFRLRVGLDTPTALATSIEFSSVALGSVADFACGIALDSKAYCWGSNSYGQLGISDYDTASYNTPTAVYDSAFPGKTVKKIAAGAYHACAIASDDQIYCWGRNNYGQLGDGSTYDTYRPVAVSTSGVLSGKTIVSVALGDYHSCVIASDNQSYCWGYNSGGRLGNNSTTNSSVPVAVTTTGVLAGKTVKTLTAGSAHTCATASDDRAYCWGAGANGRLGNNSTTNSSVPVAVTTTGVLAGKTVVSISAGNAHACAVASDSQSYCWGYNGYGQLGNNSTTQSLVPVAVSTSGVLAGKTIRSISAGQYYSCVIASNDRVYCWGYNGYGQLDSATPATSLVPMLAADSVIAGATAQSLATGVSAACVVASDAHVYCWGSGYSVNTGQKSTPTAVSTTGALAGKTILFVSVGPVHTCAIASDHQAYCWGANASGQLGNNSTLGSAYAVAVTTTGVLSGKTLIAIAAGNAYTCAIASDYQVYCWGANGTGQLGNGSTTSSSVPVAVTTTGVLSGKTVISLSVGAGHVCAIASDNQSYCWGRNNYQALGNNSTTNSSVPVAVDTSGVLAGKTIKAISAGGFQTCAIASDDHPYCWGNNSYGQLGDNSFTSSSVPVAVDTSGVLAGKSLTTIFSANWGHHSCALDTFGAMYCWGAGDYGQLGNNSTTNSSVPVAVDNSGVLAGKTITAMAAGDTFTCAIASDGHMYCWGANDSGQLGNNSTSSSSVPISVDTSGVLAGKTLAAVAMSDFDVCTLDTGGAAYCWGVNDSGQLGIGYNFHTVSTRRTSIISPGSNNYVLQYAQRTATTCSAQTTGFSAVTNTTPIAFSVNPSVANNSPITDTTWLINNPRVDAPQTYISSGTSPFSESGISSVTGNIITANSDYNGPTALWDFSLKDNTSSIDTAYCLRIAYADGTPLEQYASVPQITTAERAELNDTAYRFYMAGAGVTPKTALASSDTPTQLTARGDAFRLRTGLETTVRFRVGSMLESGSLHTCAIATDERAYCWGYNSDGELGNNSTTDSLNPVPVGTSGVLAGKTVKSISAADNHTCAIASDNQAYCWGLNGPGKLGNGTYASSTVPVPVDTSGVLAGKTVKSISVGRDHTCAIASDNQVYCWGGNWAGQLGNGTYIISPVPVPVDTSGVLAGKTVKSISVGRDHTCAIASDNQVYCWGENWAGQLGNNSTADSSVPVAVGTSGVLSGKTILSISAGGDHTCAIASDNQVYCWGYNSDGELGNNSTANSYSPVAVDTLGVLSGKTVKSISAGNSHTCAIASDNQAYCWGGNYYGGLLGNNSTTNSSTPVAVDTSGVLAGKTVKSISAGSSHTCATTSENQAYCWGSNGRGELGNNLVSYSMVPVMVNHNHTLNAAATKYTLQYAPKTASVCSAQTTGFAAVSATTPIAFAATSVLASGTAITTSSLDPTTAVSAIAQTYLSEPGAFANPYTIAPNQAALWDFSLKDNGAPANSTYCLRIVHADGTALTNYRYDMHLTTAPPIQEVKLSDIADEKKTITEPTVANATLATTDGGCADIDRSSVKTLNTSGVHVAERNVNLLGGVSFSLYCNTSDTTAAVDVSLGTSYADKSVLRVYKQVGLGSDIRDITNQVRLSNTSVNSKIVTVLSYTLIDGGELDEDGVANGTIVDPIYIGVYTAPAETYTAPASLLSATGSNVLAYGLFAVGLLGVGVVVYRRVARV